MTFDSFLMKAFFIQKQRGFTCDSHLTYNNRTLLCFTDSFSILYDIADPTNIIELED